MALPGALVKLCNVLGILPTFSKRKFTKLHQIYCVIIIAYWTWSCGSFASVRLTDSDFKSYSVVFTVVDFIVYFILTGAIICANISAVLWKDEVLKKMFQQLQELAEELHVNMSTKNSWIIFILLQILLCAIVSSDITIFWEALGYNVYKHYMRKQFIWYKINILVFVLFSLANEIRLKFKALNEVLLKTGREISGHLQMEWGSLIIPYNSNKATEKDLKRLRRLYETTCDIVDYYNEVFGLTLLLSILNNIGHILFYVLVLLEIDILPCQLLSILWLLLNLSHTMLLASASDGLAKEARRTTNICFILLNDVLVTPRTYYQRILKEEIVLLAKQSSSSNPHISAAGFFTVNYVMMGFIVSSVTSYIIVAIQFMSS